ncbi:MAG: hypothetical protein LBR60_02540 [Fibrobacter sp.]|nr:hypothetical protein [Fibrobacter sp.]
MRDIIEKLNHMGITVVFSEEDSYPVIRLYKGSDREKPLRSCILGVGTFRDSSEDSLQEMLLDLERHPA